jgi:hypothetical protein
MALHPRRIKTSNNAVVSKTVKKLHCTES